MYLTSVVKNATVFCNLLYHVRIIFYTQFSFHIVNIIFRIITNHVIRITLFEKNAYKSCINIKMLKNEKFAQKENILNILTICIASVK